MTFEESIALINKHFESLTIEEFEKNLIECGVEVIKPASESGMRLVTYDELEYLGGIYNLNKDFLQIHSENLNSFQVYNFCEVAA